MRYDNAELRERLAREYVLGTMPVRARRRLERLLATDASLAALVGEWAERFSSLDAATRDETPPARVWRAIERRVSADIPQAAPQRPPTGILAFWRGLAAAAVVACAALVLYVVTTPTPPPPKVVAVLADTSGVPGWIALAGPRSGEVSVSAIGATTTDASHAYELWGIAGGTPHSLGLLPPEADRPLLLSAAAVPADGALAISREPRGGSPTGLPTGPVVFQGKVLTPPR
ncbi:MAG TPA: anti-sigma factor [Stellaceae bacterium]|nr:anti-sigma factor [Stellaceae bacterium]